jgi:protein arginine N-methyltransferase 7
MFQLKVDPLTGDSEWMVIEEGEISIDSPKSLLATTSYLDMLNDSHRNKAFREAIDKTITEPCHVLDIGAGTGLLSMMAVRAIDDVADLSTSKVFITACESYLPMVKLMRKVLRANKMESKIRLFNKRSDELKVGVDMESRADFLVSEILDSELLGEGLIPSLQHAHDELLVKNPKTVPYRATIYGQLVESEYLSNLHDLRHKVDSLDDIILVLEGTNTCLCVKSQQYTMHCDAISEEIKLLSEPFKVFDFDFWKRPNSHGKTELHIKAIDSGTAHAVISWWVLQLDSDGTIFYSTAPKWINSSGRNWCDHWKQCAWFVQGKSISINKNEKVHLDAIHTETTISYEFKTESHHLNDIFSGNQLFVSAERVAIYGDYKWRYSWLNVIKSALRSKVSPLCVVADDSIFLAIACASFCKTSNVISFFPGLQDKGYQFLQAVAAVNGFSIDRVQLLKRNHQLTLLDTHQKKVDLLIGEPFYSGNDNMLPWQNLRFWKKRTELDSILSQDALIIPCKGVLKACAMSLPDLWRSRQCLEKIEGFDHTVVNLTIGACGGASQEPPCLPFFIWQCGDMKKLSETCAIMEFDFSKPIRQCSGKVKVKSTETGLCHGFAVWIDYVLDATNSTIISTGPEKRNWKQGVKLLTSPVEVASHRSITEIEAIFNPTTGTHVIEDIALDRGKGIVE